VSARTPTPAPVDADRLRALAEKVVEEFWKAYSFRACALLLGVPFCQALDALRDELDPGWSDRDGQ